MLKMSDFLLNCRNDTEYELYIKSLEGYLRKVRACRKVQGAILDRFDKVLDTVESNREELEPARKKRKVVKRYQGRQAKIFKSWFKTKYYSDTTDYADYAILNLSFGELCFAGPDISPEVFEANQVIWKGLERWIKEQYKENPMDQNRINCIKTELIKTKNEQDLLDTQWEKFKNQRLCKKRSI